MGLTFKRSVQIKSIARFYSSVVQTNKNTFNCKLLIVGGGTGGCSIAWRLSKHLKDNDIIVLEPSKDHYYQPLFTLIAAGLKPFSDSIKPTLSVLPANVAWLQDRAQDFDPKGNVVYTWCENKIVYEYMVVALGLVNDYDAIPGLKKALDSDRPVTTIYSPTHCVKTWKLLQQFQGGHALFTYPARGGKCSGAAQKIMYLAEDYWSKKKVRERTSISYVTGNDRIFGVPKYAAALTNIARNKHIVVNKELELNEISPKGAAVFVDCNGKTLTVPYNFLHVSPPMSTPPCLSKCPELCNNSGYLDVDKYTLCHKTYGNVFGLGDCIGTPNSKTAAAIGEQSWVVANNLQSVMRGHKPSSQYTGYGACPILTSYKTGILAEFLYDKKLCETFPFDQSKERYLYYYLNTNVLPNLYWNKLIRGKWNGPSAVRKVINPFRKN